ncbi:cell division protein FtsY [Marinomonas sp. SBI22]|uniref:signal recognition particle-docking protein FtsY n=1 Tax=unclassified Marinomonas TaxID=196814 RepID=UPI0007AF8179|nr:MULTISPECIES: signal recognition particle-docking protein FtsY [unclassified Marinomonas]KZM40675.1 cell division protein FtsY [Marinomonas sp. SBI22]KZM42376.1 cell division protein FtsY [Marinomonas sp. SBI8L]
MEFVNSIIAFFTPYFGEYAQYAPIVIGALLAILAYAIKPRVIKKMGAEASEPDKKDTEQLDTLDSKQDSTVSQVKEQTSQVEAQAETLDVEAQEPKAAETTTSELESAPVAEPQVEEADSGLTWAQRVKAGLSRTRNGLGNGLANLIVGSKQIDDDLLEELETQLLMADVGVEATQSLIATLTEKMNRKELKDADALMASLKHELREMLAGSAEPLEVTEPEVEGKKAPYVILMVGVNGVGKTTTIGKLTKKFQAQGKKVILAAGDTFRAAAVEQLQVWGERNQVPVVAQQTGSDSASVIFDAIDSATAKGFDVVIADTAGRLQNKSNLMNELSKVVRVMKKLDQNAPHEVMLVLDAGTGQNAISQAKLFSEAVGVSGITLTKLDGTAKGGIIFAIAKEFEIPIRFIGVGEQVDDLRDFDAEVFVDALFEQD